MAYITLEDTKEFKQAVDKFVKMQGNKRILAGGSGLCVQFNSFCPKAYDIMDCLLTEFEYLHGHLGEDGVYTEDRKNFVTLLQVMTTEDIYEICK